MKIFKMISVLIVAMLFSATTLVQASDITIKGSSAKEVTTKSLEEDSEGVVVIVKETSVRWYNNVKDSIGNWYDSAAEFVVGRSLEANMADLQVYTSICNSQNYIDACEDALHSAKEVEQDLTIILQKLKEEEVASR